MVKQFKLVQKLETLHISDEPYSIAKISNTGQSQQSLVTPITKLWHGQYPKKQYHTTGSHSMINAGLTEQSWWEVWERVQKNLIKMKFGLSIKRDIGYSKGRGYYLEQAVRRADCLKFPRKWITVYNVFYWIITLLYSVVETSHQSIIKWGNSSTFA